MQDKQMFVVILIFAFILLGIGFCHGYKIEKNRVESLLISKEICKYEVDSKTGDSYLVISATGKKLYGENE